MAGLGKKTFTAGEVLTAADVNGYLMEQSVMVFGGTAARSSAIPTPSEGMVTYLSDLNDIQAYDGSNWISTGLTAGTTTANYGWPIPASGSIASLGTAIDTTVAGLGSGLTLIKSQTIGSAVSSVTVTDAFNSTYDAYKIIVSGGAASNNDLFRLQLGSSTTGYYAGTSAIIYGTGAAVNVGDSNTSAWTRVGRTLTDNLTCDCDLINPFLTKRTLIFGSLIDAQVSSASGYLSGFHDSTTSFTAFTLIPNVGTITGGTIRVYGYKNS